MPCHDCPQLRRPWCQILHVSGQEPHDPFGVLCAPFFSRSGRLMMGTDCRAITKGHAEGLIPVSDLFKKALPHPKLQPANEQLCGNSPGTKLRWQGAPLRAVLMATENRRDRPSKGLRGLLLRTDVFDQRLPSGPGLIRKNRLHHAHHKQLCNPFRHSRSNRP